MHAAQKERRAKRQLPTRDEQIKSLQTEDFDVLIIGGGASGSGCALDAVTRGKKNCGSLLLFSLLHHPTSHSSPPSFSLLEFLYMPDSSVATFEFAGQQIFHINK